MKKTLFTLCIICFFATYEAKPAVNAAAADYESGIDQLIENKNKEKNTRYLPQIQSILSGLRSKKAGYSQSGQTSQNREGVQLQVDNELPIVSSVYDLSGAYQVYALKTLLVTNLKETGSFADAITDKVQWRIPIRTLQNESGLAIMTEEDGNLRFSGTSVGESTAIWKFTDEDIRNAVMEVDGLSDAVDSMKIASSYLYRTTFVWLTAEDREYLIPFSYFADCINIENGKVYTLSEIIKIFDKYFDEQQMIDSPGYGGAPFRQQPIIPVRLAVIIVLSSFTGIVGLVFYIKKGDKKIAGKQV